MTLLQNVLSGQQDFQALDAEIAYARSELKAYTDGSTLSEATARLSLAASLANTQAALVTEQTARATADTAEASARTDLAARVTTAEGNITTTTAAITTEQTARATAVDALATTLTTVSAVASKTRTYSQDTAPSTGMVFGDLWFDTNDNNKAYRYDGTAWQPTDDTRIASNVAAITTEQTARATADSALATSITTLSTTVGDHTTSIQTVAESVNGINAKYTVKIDSNGYISGFGLISTANTATPFAEFAVVADRFSIAPVATNPNAVDGSPFFVITSPETISGITINPGIYLKSAFIHDASIDSAKIADAAIDDAKIFNLDASKITTGSLSADRITTGSLDAKIATLNAAVIGTGTIDIARIANLTADKITTGTFSTDRFAANSITADKINSNSLEIRDSSGGVVFSASKTLDGAYISNAAIDTLKLAGDSVSVVSSYDSGSIINTSDYTYTVSFSMPNDGTYLVMFTYLPYASYDTTATAPYRNVYIDGTLIYGANGSAVLSAFGFSKSVDCSAGTHSFSLRFQWGVNYGAAITSPGGRIFATLLRRYR